MSHFLPLAVAAALVALVPAVHAAEPVTSSTDGPDITIKNGLVSITVNGADGSLKRIRKFDGHAYHDLSVTDQHAAYEAHGSDFANDPQKAMYWDANNSVAVVPPGLTEPTKGYFRYADGQPKVALVTDTADRAEVSVTSAPTPLFPFAVDYRYVVFRGQSGFYAYVTLHHGADQPATTFFQNRFVFKTVMDGTFDQWATGDGKFVPIPQAAIAEQVSDATFRLADGTVKTKYMNSVYWSERPVYGYVGSNLGLWAIEASPEYHNGGPIKQGQTLHDNVMLRVMQSVHFGASAVTLAKGEVFDKVYGPFFVYANQGAGPAALWADAEREHAAQVASWPYQWVASNDYVKARGKVEGSVTLAGKPATGAWAILSRPDVPWSEQTKGYAYWGRVDAHGHFDLPHVVPGDYALTLSGADQPRELTLPNVHVDAGQALNLGQLAWAPENHGKLVWQIGRFDRSAAEFRDGDDARQFEMYRRYATVFPHDVDYTVGRSMAARDWNYAQWSVYSQQPQWRIHFDGPGVRHGLATLTIGFASAQPATGHPLTDLRVAVNGTEVAAVRLPKTGTAGYRGGVQDSPYNLRQIQFDASLLKAVQNTIALYHADAMSLTGFSAASAAEPAGKSLTPGQVMYDALRLEVAP